MNTTSIVAATVFGLLLLERVIFLELLKKFLPKLKETTSFLRASNMTVSTLHAGASFLHGAYLLYVTEYSQQYTLQEMEPNFAFHMFLEFGYYLYDTLSEVIQLIKGEKDEDSTAAAKKKKQEQKLCDAADEMTVQAAGKKKKAPAKKGSACSAILQAGFLLHHLPPLAGLTSYYFYSQHQTPMAKRVTTVVILRVFLWHATTPMQNLRWFLDHLKVDPKNSVLYKANYSLFMSLFFLIRIYGCLPLLRSVIWLYDLPQSTTIWQILTEVMPFHCVIWTGILYVLSCYWWYLNLKRAKKVFGGDVASASSTIPRLADPQKALLRSASD